MGAAHSDEPKPIEATLSDDSQQATRQSNAGKPTWSYAPKSPTTHGGRRNELIITKGDILISPFEVEDALRIHPAVAHIFAFPAPHCDDGEVVGVVVVLHANSMVSLQELRAVAAEAKLPSCWLPSALVYVDAPPQTNAYLEAEAGGWSVRDGIAGRLCLPELPDERYDTWHAAVAGADVVLRPGPRRAHVALDASKGASSAADNAALGSSLEAKSAKSALDEVLRSIRSERALWDSLAVDWTWKVI